MRLSIIYDMAIHAGSISAAEIGYDYLAVTSNPDRGMQARDTGIV